MRLTFRAHALRRMFERSVSVDDARDVLGSGETIADYPNDTPYASRLMLGWSKGRPLHVVAAYNPSDDETIVITVYEPDPALWEADFRSKRP
ncbi:MAG: DUF4258 domain-containing protein [Betaproteobacteria bacterium]|nr:DUF4258 domain-containing protein [Betaproteobacteria bacterium]